VLWGATYAAGLVVFDVSNEHSSLILPKSV